IRSVPKMRSEYTPLLLPRTLVRLCVWISVRHTSSGSRINGLRKTLWSNAKARMQDSMQKLGVSGALIITKVGLLFVLANEEASRRETHGVSQIRLSRFSLAKPRNTLVSAVILVYTTARRCLLGVARQSRCSTTAE